MEKGKEFTHDAEKNWLSKCVIVSLSPLHQYKPEGLDFRMDQAWPSLQGPFKDDLTLCVEEEFTTYQFLKISRSHNWVL